MKRRATSTAATLPFSVESRCFHSVCSFTHVSALRRRLVHNRIDLFANTLAAMELDKPTTAPTLNGVSGGAASKDATVVRGRLLCAAAILSRPTRRLSALRLTLAVVSLSMVLWVFAGTFIWQGSSSSGSSDQQLLATANLRFEGTKLCEEMGEGHVEKEFYHPESCFSRADIQHILLRLVWTFAGVLESNAIPYWLDSGTLLGSYREKTLISYDEDTDIGITEASYFQLRDNQFNFSSEYELLVLGGKFHRSGPRDVAIPGRFIHKDSGLYVDIFVFLDNATNPEVFGPVPSICFHACHRCPHRGKWTREFTIPKNWVYPLQQCAFGGRNVSCPAEPELYLDYLYGPDFMTPDKKTR